MCHYSVLKCTRCRKAQPICSDLCEKFERGTICVDESKLAKNSDRCNVARSRIESTMTNHVGVYGNSRNTMALDLYEILPHKYVYQDGCHNCSG